MCVRVHMYMQLYVSMVSECIYVYGNCENIWFLGELIVNQFTSGGYLPAGRIIQLLLILASFHISACLFALKLSEEFVLFLNQSNNKKSSSLSKKLVSCHSYHTSKRWLIYPWSLSIWSIGNQRNFRKKSVIEGSYLSNQVFFSRDMAVSSFH